MRIYRQFSGFTLVEMAVVLTITGLLLGALFVPLRVQFEQRDYNQAQKEISEIKEAVIGFALINSRLPCPDTSGDGIEDACTSVSASSTTGGNIPWVTLGVKNIDPWGQSYRYRVNDAYSTTFTLATTPSGNGIIRVCTDTSCASLLGNNLPAVIYSSGKNGATQPPVSADELENVALTTHADFDRTFVSHTYSEVVGTEFDDLVYWVSGSVLMGRMVAAGKLP
jgi:prepilin-type N-terminal cleavage/methylation domain-containing protein